MTLLKPTRMTTVLIPYEQLLIQTFHHNGNLIPEQNQLFQLAIDTSSTSQPAQNQSIFPTLFSQTSPSLATLEGGACTKQ